MLRILVGLFCLTVLLAACVSVEPTIEITPETVPPEIKGAKWLDLPVAYCIVRDGQPAFVSQQTLVALAQKAIGQWGIPASYQGECAGGIVSDDGINEIGWGDLGTRSDNLTEAGSTNLRYRASLAGGAAQIVEADITLERDPDQHANERCLYTTLLHEAGHMFGVPHLDKYTVMSPVIIDCLQALTAADRAALADIYDAASP